MGNKDAFVLQEQKNMWNKMAEDLPAKAELAPLAAADVMIEAEHLNNVVAAVLVDLAHVSYLAIVLTFNMAASAKQALAPKVINSIHAVVPLVVCVQVKDQLK